MGQGQSSRQEIAPSGSSSRPGDALSSDSSKLRQKQKAKSDEITSDSPSSLYQSIDGGHLIPMSGTYATVARDWDKAVVHQLIKSRQIAPFYRGLQDEIEPPSDDTADDAIDDNTSNGFSPKTTAASEALQTEITLLLDEVGVKADQESLEDQGRVGMRARETKSHRAAEAEMYLRGTTECPICMLNFPQNINSSRCCDQPICTECLVQIKRAEPDTTHVETEPVACPFCVEPKFGVVYRPPAPMNRSKPDGTTDLVESNSMSRSESASSTLSPLTNSSSPRTDLRRKSLSANAPEVVSVDSIHPNYQEKVEAVRATAARRANRKIIFRQVGDRLIPVGISSSRDIAALVEHQVAQAAQMQQSASSSGSASPRRGRRRNQSQVQPANDLQMYGQVGHDLEELMMNEAIRLSLLEADEADNKRREEEAKAKSATPIPVPTPAAAGASSLTQVSGSFRSEHVREATNDRLPGLLLKSSPRTSVTFTAASPSKATDLRNSIDSRPGPSLQRHDTTDSFFDHADPDTSGAGYVQLDD